MTGTRGRGFGNRELQSKPEEEWQALAWEIERGIEQVLLRLTTQRQTHDNGNM